MSAALAVNYPGRAEAQPPRYRGIDAADFRDPVERPIRRNDRVDAMREACADMQPVVRAEPADLEGKG